jgi:hypothetical protein
MEFTSDQKQTAIIAAAAAVGVGQVIVLKKYMDATTPVLVPQLAQMGSFAKPSALVGIGAGAAAIILSLFVLRDSPYVHALAAYGGTSLISGLLSGLDMLKV